MNRKRMILFLTALSTALIAGLFYSWYCSVIPGLREISDSEYISVMKSINLEIQNPVFFICFFGSAILLPASAYLNFNGELSKFFWLLLGAAVIYWIGVLGVTVFGNVPFNESLDAFDAASATPDELKITRAGFE